MSASYLRRCAGKKRETKETAGASRKKLAAAVKKPVSNFSIYRCDQCLGWHVGGNGSHFISRERRAGKRPNKKMRGRV